MKSVSFASSGHPLPLDLPAAFRFFQTRLDQLEAHDQSTQACLKKKNSVVHASVVREIEQQFALYSQYAQQSLTHFLQLQRHPSNKFKGRKPQCSLLEQCGVFEYFSKRMHRIYDAVRYSYAIPCQYPRDWQVTLPPLSQGAAVMLITQQLGQLARSANAINLVLQQGRIRLKSPYGLNVLQACCQAHQSYIDSCTLFAARQLHTVAHQVIEYPCLMMMVLQGKIAREFVDFYMAFDDNPVSWICSD